MQTNIRHKLKKFTALFLKAQEENLMEADTSQRIAKFFEDVLEYDPFTEITREMEVKGKRVDLTMKIDGVIRFIVEVKRAQTELHDRHVQQGELYASEANIQWVLVTNGVAWNLYHLTFDEGIEYERVFSVTLAMDAESLSKASDMLGLLHRASVKAGQHDVFWKQCSALGAESIGKAIFFESTLLLIRREIRKREGILIDTQELAEGIYALFSEDAKQLIKPKIRSKRACKPVKPAQPDTTVEVIVPTAAVKSIASADSVPPCSGIA